MQRRILGSTVGYVGIEGDTRQNRATRGRVGGHRREQWRYLGVQRAT